MGEPARIRACPQEEAAVECEPGDQIDPVTEGAQARHGHVAGADHERHQVHPQPFEDRHCEEEEQGGAVHAEKLLVELGRHQIQVGLRELRAHHQPLNAAQDQEDEPGHDEADADHAVADRHQPAAPSRRRLPGALELLEVGAVVGVSLHEAPFYLKA